MTDEMFASNDGKTLPLISVVTPVFNGAAHIAEAIESILSQDYPNVEYIIVDGGSTDGTLDVIRDFMNSKTLRHSINALISEPDQGMYDAIAKGFNKCKGEIFCYLNSDDVFCGGALSSVGCYFNEHPQVDLIYHEDIVMIDGWRFPNVRQPDNVDTSDLLNGHVLFQDGIFWRRRLYESCGGMRRDLRFAGDYDLWLRMSLRASFVKRPNHVSCFRIRAGQLSTHMDKYRAEMERSKTEMMEAMSPMRRLRWTITRKLGSIARSVRRRSRRDRLHFPIDFNNLPPPPIRVHNNAESNPLSPIDKLPAERLLFSVPDTRFGDKRINHIYLDARHGIAIVSPPIDSQELAELYRNNYSNPQISVAEAQGTSPYRRYNGQRAWEKKLFKRPIDRLVPQINWSDNTLSELQRVLRASDIDVASKIKFLDVGCFEGALLDQVRKKTDWQTFGIEPNEIAVSIARSNGHNVYTGSAENARERLSGQGPFDVVFMGQSIEHVDDPVEVLYGLRGLLTADGLIVVSTPNLDSREIDWFGPTWAHWHAPYHRHIFSRRGLKALARRAGFQPVYLTSFSHPYWTAMSLMQSSLGLGGVVSHFVQPDFVTAMSSHRIQVLKQLILNGVGKGDYCFLSMRPSRPSWL